jgi:hypothetical protein
MPDLEKQLKMYEKQLEDQRKELVDKNLKIEDLKYLIANNEEVLTSYKDRLKVLETSLEEAKHESNLYKKELFSVRRSTYSKEEILAKATDEHDTITQLKKENEKLRTELE